MTPTPDDCLLLYHRRGDMLRLKTESLTNHELREVLVGLWARMHPEDRADHLRELQSYQTDDESWLSTIASAIARGIADPNGQIPLKQVATFAYAEMNDYERCAGCGARVRKGAIEAGHRPDCPDVPRRDQGERAGATGPDPHDAPRAHRNVSLAEFLAAYRNALDAVADGVSRCVSREIPDDLVALSLNELGYALRSCLYWADQAQLGVQRLEGRAMTRPDLDTAFPATSPSAHAGTLDA